MCPPARFCPPSPARPGLAAVIAAIALLVTAATAARAADGRVRVRGTAEDAVTGQPIPAFRVTLGWGIAGGPIGFHAIAQADAKDGEFDATFDGFGPRQYAVRVSADGYAPVDSPAWDGPAEGPPFDARLVPTRGLAVKVVTPDGEPAGGAVVLVNAARAGVWVEGGRRDKTIPAGRPQPQADAAGAFAIQPTDPRYDVIALHEAGFASATEAAVRAAGGTLTLAPWGRIEGVAVGADGKPVPGARVEVSYMTGAIANAAGQIVRLPEGFLLPRLTETLKAGPDGSFAVARALPGHIAFLAVWPTGGGGRGAAPPESMIVWVPAGATLTARPGGPRAVAVGRVVLPDGAELAEGRAFDIGTLTGPAGTFGFKPDADGEFRVDGVRPGEYAVALTASEPAAAGDARPSKVVDAWSGRLTVPAGEPAGGVMDVGAVDLAPGRPPAKR